MTTTGAKFSARTVDGVEVIEFTRADLLDAMYIKQLGDDLYHHIMNKDGVKVVLDFDRVEYLSSASLGMIVALHKVITKQNGKLALANITDDMHRVFKMTKLHKLVKIYDSVDKAVKGLK